MISDFKAVVAILSKSLLLRMPMLDYGRALLKKSDLFLMHHMNNVPLWMTLVTASDFRWEQHWRDIE